MSSIIERLTEGVVNRDMRAEGSALLSKWEKTGLLEGLDKDSKRSSMARLLELQAKELLRETSTMNGGDVEGFAAVAFPIVRRVFAGLIANDLVSVQPMSLPSGLIFFLDFTVSSNGAGLPRLGYGTDGSEDSVYGGQRIASQITGGVIITGNGAEEGPYNLNNGYGSPTGSVAAVTLTFLTSSTYSASAGAIPKLVQYDAELEAQSGVASVAVCTFTVSDLTGFNEDDFVAVNVQDASGSNASINASGSAGGGGAAYVSITVQTIVYSDLTLQSVDATAQSAPSTSDLVMLMEDGSGTATLNTDIKAFISRDSGANFTQGTLVEEGTWGSSAKRIVAFHNLDISSQPSGTSVCYKITTHNQSASKETRVHAVSHGWK